MTVARLAALLLCVAALPLYAHAATDDMDALLRAARELVAREALTPPSPEEAASAVLKGYLRSVDAWSTYLSPEEMRRIGRQKREGFVGVGMDALQDGAGLVHCLPFPGGPAEKAGVRYGDILHSVDGVRVSDLPFLLLESQVRGAKGTQVRLGVTGDEGARTCVVTRDAVALPHIALDSAGPFPRLRLFRFTPETPALLREAIGRLGDPRALVLDLRGNPGGDMRAALDAAALFLDRGKVLAIQAGRNGEVVVHETKERAAFAMPLVLWQDGFTASAAEVFIAALCTNGRATSLGQRSFGKGVSQRVVAAGNGGSFILTTAELLQPDGKTYHGVGLEPDLVVRTSRNAEPDYFRRSYEALGLRP